MSGAFLCSPPDRTVQSWLLLRLFFRRRRRTSLVVSTLHRKRHSQRAALQRKVKLHQSLTVLAVKHVATSVPIRAFSWTCSSLVCVCKVSLWLVAPLDRTVPEVLLLLRWLPRRRPIARTEPRQFVFHVAHCGIRHARVCRAR